MVPVLRWGRSSCTTRPCGSGKPRFGSRSRLRVRVCRSLIPIHIGSVRDGRARSGVHPQKGGVQASGSGGRVRELPSPARFIHPDRSAHTPPAIGCQVMVLAARSATTRTLRAFAVVDTSRQGERDGAHERKVDRTNPRNRTGAVENAAPPKKQTQPDPAQTKTNPARARANPNKPARAGQATPAKFRRFDFSTSQPADLPSFCGGTRRSAARTSQLVLAVARGKMRETARLDRRQTRWR